MGPTPKILRVNPTQPISEVSAPEASLPGTRRPIRDLPDELISQIAAGAGAGVKGIHRHDFTQRGWWG